MSNDVNTKDCVLKTVMDMQGLNFYIPSYQRGYRWEESQIKALLTDLFEYKKNVSNRGGNSKICKFYCLQPLVVKEKTWGVDNEIHGYEVIDGQQRLTTLFLILSYLTSYFKENNIDFKPFTIDYQTRGDCKDFFQSEKFKEVNEDNIDFLFISKGYKTIEEWFSTNTPKRKNDIAYTLISEAFDEEEEDEINDDFLAKFIWYLVSEHEEPYGVFSRLNSGKISLSDAELVKALILNEGNKDNGDDKFDQNIISDEWNEIENTFHDELFWSFINPNPDGYQATKIDYLLEIVARCEKKEEYLQLKEQEVYPVFTYFYQLVGSTGKKWNVGWNKIKEMFRTMKTWYSKRALYHYIGYLINQKGNSLQQKFNLLCGSLNNNEECKDVDLSTLYSKGLLTIYSEIGKNKFFEVLKKACKNTLFVNKTDEFLQLDNKYYPRENNLIHNILLLFNLASVQNQISENARYPFNLHYQAALTSKWSLEHIHAQNEQKRKWTSEEIENVKKILYTMNVTLDSEEKQIRIDFLKFLSDATINSDKLVDGLSLWMHTNKAITGIFMGKNLEKKVDTNGFEYYTSTFDKDDSLKNMALLQGDKNAAFNNKLFFEKREKLAQYENVEKKTAFVPICTRNVFFKHYSPDSLNPYMWDESAAREYVSAMIDIVSNYIGTVPKILSESLDTPISYGLWWDEKTEKESVVE